MDWDMNLDSHEESSVIDGVVDDDFLMMLDDNDDDEHSLPQLGNYAAADDIADDLFHPPSPPQQQKRGVQRYFSEGMVPLQNSTPILPTSSSHEPPIPTLIATTPVAPTSRGVARHVSENNGFYSASNPYGYNVGGPPPRRGVSRALSEAPIPEHSSPIPNEICIGSAAQITPEQSDLQSQYQRTLQRLSKSMRRSDQTRSIVQRQRSSNSASGGFGQTTTTAAFGTQTEDEQVAEARRRLFRMISETE